MCIYMFVDKKNLNRTLAIDSRFQIFAVRLPVKFIDKRAAFSRKFSSLSKLRIMHTVLYFCEG